MTPFYSAGAIKDQPPRTPLDPAAATAYGRLVDAAYEMYATGTDLFPERPSDFPPAFRMTAWVTMSDFAFLGEKQKKFYGFVATEIDDPYSHLIVIRGTEDHVEWWDDVMMWPWVFRPVPCAGLVHGGFYRIYRTMKVHRVGGGAMTSQTFADQIEELVRGIAPSREPAGEHHVVVTGHSLGAALCTLYVMEHAIKKRKAGQKRHVTVERLCTFASPRVGMHRFVTQFDGLPIDSWRVVNELDLVPKVPPRFLLFDHVASEYGFSSAGEIRDSWGCRHALNTYLHALDPSIAVDADCRRGVA